MSYSTSFGNDSPGFTRYMGKRATLTNIGGEGSPRYQLVEEKGNHEDNADIDQNRAAKYVLLPGETKLPPMGIDDLSLGHMANWFECMRSRQQPNCTVQDGFAHSVACMDAAQAYSFWERSNTGTLPPKRLWIGRPVTRPLPCELKPLSRAGIDMVTKGQICPTRFVAP